MFNLISSDKITYEYFLQDNICRLCWSPNASNPLVENEFMRKILECLGINLFGNILFPNKICSNCIANVEQFHNFKICSYKADQKLQKIIEHHFKLETKVKTEVVTSDDDKQIAYSGDEVLNLVETKVEEHSADENNEPLNPLPEKKIKAKKKSIKPDLKIRKSNTFCSICQIEFKIKEKYKLHIAEEHGVINNGSSISFKCFGCDKTFPQRKIRLAHEKSVCEKLKEGYACKICNKFQQTRRLYEAHVRNHQLQTTENVKDILAFECTYCNQSFKVKKELNQHIVQHIIEKKKYVCEHCGRVFSRHDYLYKHKLLHTGTKKHVCSYCGFRATQKSSLNVHIRKHTGERPFSCDICDQKCVSSSNLLAHRRRHLGLKNYKCELCDKKFGYKVSLEEHIAAIHERTQEFTCEHCNAIYTRKRGLQRHLLSKHKKDGDEKQLKES